METPNARALGDHLRALGMPPADVRRVFRSFNAQAEPFRTESERHGA
jgi:sulfhydrogenase subunit delta